jgi:hypothetical protein
MFAVAAAQAEVWEDAVSHVSASAGVASHVHDGMPARGMLKVDKGLLPQGSVSGFSGLLESQMGETSEDEEELKDVTAGTSAAGVPSKGVEVGDILNERYGLVGLLGAGAFGQVFLAEDKVQRIHVAIKVQGAGDRQSQVAKDEIALLNVVAKCRREQTSKGAPNGGDFVVELKGCFSMRGSQGEFESCGVVFLDVLSVSRRRAYSAGVLSQML